MSQADQSVEWYLARDGQQHGPISAPEMEKIIELGYLLPTDLVWRQGFDEWKPAAEAFPNWPKTAAPPPPAPPPATSPRPAAESVVAPAGLQPGSKAGPQAGASRDVHPQARGGSLQDRLDRPGGGTRDVIAAEAARREDAARRARDGGHQPGSGQPLAPAASELGPRPGTGGPRPARGGEQHDGYGAQPIGTQGANPPGSPPGTAASGRSGDDDAWEDEAPRRRFPKFAIAAVLLLAILGGGAYALLATGQLDPFVNRISSATSPKPSSPPLVSATSDGRKQQAVVDFATDPAEVDRQFQRTALWQLLKAEFPDWYKERVTDTARLKGEGKADKAISQHLAEQLVALRRKHVADALAASPQQLKSVASTFLDNLERLSRHSIDACYGFISQGETNPLIVELTRASEHTPALQKQAAAIFSAIAEGRRAPSQHRQPTREDYDQLAMQLAKRGWSPMDLQLFSDARSLARAAPERVCRMVQDWFAAQLAVSDEGVQVRLLIEALKPVVAG